MPQNKSFRSSTGKRAPPTSLSIHWYIETHIVPIQIRMYREPLPALPEDVANFKVVPLLLLLSFSFFCSSVNHSTEDARPASLCLLFSCRRCLSMTHPPVLHITLTSRRANVDTFALVEKHRQVVKYSGVC